MRTAIASLLLLLSARLVTAADFRLPAFPVPTLVMESGSPTEVSVIRLLRELHSAGLRGFDRLEASDADYALLHRRSLETLTTWLDAVCTAVEFDLRRARTRNYDGAVFARLLDVATSLGALQGRPRPLALPIGTVTCQRSKAWGGLPADGAGDKYIIFATEDGMVVYDPPTRQMSPLASFPNKEKISEIRF